MTIALKPLRDQVIVITGASSGIGLATAQAAARRGARLVLGSRNDEALSEIERQIIEAGGRAIHVSVDVSRREDVQRLARTAIETFGGFDTWVNNAGISIFGRLEEVSDEDHRRLFDINFWGLVYGSLIAVEHFKQRGGALINLGSVASDLSLPVQGMYSASKHAVKGFTDALRMELEQEGAPISVTLIKPASINTPFPQHAKNYTDREPMLPPPVYSPDEVAYAILEAAARPLRDVYVGGSGKAISALHQYAPRTVDRLGEAYFFQQRDEPPRDPDGALYHAGRDGRVHGDHPGHVVKTSAYTRASLHPVLTGALLAAVGVTAVALLANGRSER